MKHYIIGNVEGLRKGYTPKTRMLMVAGYIYEHVGLSAKARSAIAGERVRREMNQRVGIAHPTQAKN